MSEGSIFLWNEIEQQLEELDKQQARLQAQGNLAYRYSRWCCEMFAQLGSQRSQLEQIILEWQEANHLYGEPRG
jgi:hypothetical protein